MLPEATAAPNLIFPQTGLAFVDAGGGAGCQWCTVKIRVDALFIHGMTGFVQCAEQGFVQIILLDTGGDTHVTQVEFGGEGVGRFVLATSFQIVAVLFDDLQAKG